jgi:hypothetical protein
VVPACVREQGNIGEVIVVLRRMAATSDRDVARQLTDLLREQANHDAGCSCPHAAHRTQQPNESYPSQPAGILI